MDSFSSTLLFDAAPSPPDFSSLALKADISLLANIVFD